MSFEALGCRFSFVVYCLCAYLCIKYSMIHKFGMSPSNHPPVSSIILSVVAGLIKILNPSVTAVLTLGEVYSANP